MQSNKSEGEVIAAVRLALIADTDTPGQSGVGDYALMLADELRTLGVIVEVFSIGAVGSPQRSELTEGVAAFQPDWVSFQFVPYAYAHRGLVSHRTLLWKKLRGHKGTHFMFHEIWIGSHCGASIRSRIMGFLQKRGILSVMRCLNPSIVHCSNRLYSSILDSAAISNSVLPLFGNIPVICAEADPYVSVVESIQSGSRRKDWTVAAFFGTIHRGSGSRRVLRWLHENARRHGRRLLVVSLGHCPDADLHFRDFAESIGDKGDVNFLVQGKMPSQELSAWLGSADCGVATTPFNIIEKSGSAIAFAEHGVPVFVTDRGSSVRDGDIPIADLTPRFWLAEDSVLKNLADVPPRRSQGSLLGVVAASLLDQLAVA